MIKISKIGLVGGLLMATIPLSGWGASMLPATNQTTSYPTGSTTDDGYYKKGITWSSGTRFTTLSDGSLRDNLTRLVWLKNANCWGTLTWAEAITKISTLNSNVATSTVPRAGCTDTTMDYTGTSADWRLPSRNELAGLLDYGDSSYLLLTSGFFSSPLSPFSSTVQTSSGYWSSTALASTMTISGGGRHQYLCVVCEF
ncbi:MAG: DUF1566 domain-containing protein [Magnetococcales bacterium]|nr:DUF1566 domain-containing protein [Magnetococcales bacterium]